jgi:hypothetical protein
MHSLKATLSGKDSPSKQANEVNGSLLKGVNKSKNSTMWALDADGDDAATEESLKTDNLMRILNEKLQAAYQRDSKNLTEVQLSLHRLRFRGSSNNSRIKLEEPNRSCLIYYAFRISSAISSIFLRTISNV